MNLQKKLGLAMAVIVLVLGAGFYLVDRLSVQLYFDELSQRLNGSLAMYVVNTHALFDQGEVDSEIVEMLVERAMVVNPTAEIYLLDPEGRILAHGLDPERVQMTTVDLAPVQHYLSGEARGAVHGVDPGKPGAQKVFSAFPVEVEGTLMGYVYVVLGGAQYEAVAEDVSQSYAQTMIIVAIVSLVALSLLVGSLVFSTLTRPLRRLTSAVTGYTESDFVGDVNVVAAAGSNDEIAELSRAFVKMSEKIDQQMEFLRENDRLRRELVSNVSHDLRTPLASMQGYIETLLIKGDQLTLDERTQYLEVARKHAVHLGSLIEALFELAKLDSSRMSPEFEEFPLMELVQDVMQMFELQAQEKSISLAIEPPIAPVTVYADIGLIQRVLENLIGNALKYTPKHGTVTISVAGQSECVEVRVVDTGFGIPEEHLDRIFDRFYRAEQGEESLANSSGLGLAITKRILELHGSEIKVTSELQAGTAFEFELPVAA
ncbi:MAG: HAMP domain-containing sensor histidine kinase [Pseudomonadota bacterium]